MLTCAGMRIRSIHGDACSCIIIRIGKVGNRLVYPTVTQVKKVYRGGRDQRDYYSYY